MAAEDDVVVTTQGRCDLADVLQEKEVDVCSQDVHTCFLILCVLVTVYAA